MACGWPRGSLGGSPGRYFARSAENSGFEICRILPCPRTYFHERIRCRLDSAPTKQFTALHPTNGTPCLSGDSPAFSIGLAYGTEALLSLDSPLQPHHVSRCTSHVSRFPSAP